ncbi:hypothetical protein [Rhizobium sp. CSW-27]|uniref:hypothetical protein n=1 Tax=Rhizobium sp. CSW-27 TaxID=2839985 RepID=UPI001C0305C3|nr:hypothetical protein [Rhizobium sp. CSW-27]MBT9370305.1 hypothetical protein [Rhizobium sp. CSW-27]
MDGISAVIVGSIHLHFPFLGGGGWFPAPLVMPPVFPDPPSRVPCCGDGLGAGGGLGFLSVIEIILWWYVHLGVKVRGDFVTVATHRLILSDIRPNCKFPDDLSTGTDGLNSGPTTQPQHAPQIDA